MKASRYKLAMESTLCQHLADDGLDSKRNLECNATGYRPAYSLDEIISKEGVVSEIVLKVALNQ